MPNAPLSAVARAEQVMRRALVEACMPGHAECLPCYLQRVVRRYGCDGKLAWTHRWQGHQRFHRRRTSGLTAWARSRGGFCDCEVLLNVYRRELVDDSPDPAEAPCAHGPRWWA